MTLKERVFNYKELMNLYTQKTKEYLSLKEEKVTLTLLQDWEKEIEEIKKRVERRKRIEEEYEDLRQKIEEYEAFFKNLLLELNLEIIEFDLGDYVFRVSLSEERPIKILSKAAV